MERPIMKDPIFLAQKSEPATADDLSTARDLLDESTIEKGAVSCRDVDK